jgi:hypothetical protein
MKKLTCSAIALTMTCAAGFASDGEWSALDQEVGALASTLSLDGGPTVSGLLQTQYGMADGAMLTPLTITIPPATPLTMLPLPTLTTKVVGALEAPASPSTEATVTTVTTWRLTLPTKASAAHTPPGP